MEIKETVVLSPRLSPTLIIDHQQGYGDSSLVSQAVPNSNY